MFGGHILGGSPIWYPQTSSDFFFIFVYSENFMCLTYVVKKLQFWRPPFEETPKFYLSLVFTLLKNFVRLAQKVKNFEL